MNCTEGPVIEGNWLWLPSIGVPVPAWGFVSPGTEPAVELGTPGANGNYTNGKTESLLGVSAVCQGKGNAQNARQQDHGIHATAPLAPSGQRGAWTARAFCHQAG